MREAMGNSLLMNLVIIFVAIVILFFVGILSYSKAYRVKNRIIEIIEKNGGYNSSAIDEINTDLKAMGYSSISIDQNDCKSDKNDKTSYQIGDYPYCIGERYTTEKCTMGPNGKEICIPDKTSSKYYKVKTFMTFSFPVIGDMLKFKVSGETKILGKNYNY